VPCSGVAFKGNLDYYDFREVFTMRISTFSFLSLVFLGSLLSVPAQAAWYDWIFPSDSTNLTRPYLEDGKTPNNAQYENDTWKPEDWVEAMGTKKKMIDRLYSKHIITNQHTTRVGLPVLDVGNPFLMLGDRAKRHVAAFVDYAFGITASSPDGTFLVELDKGDVPLGVYTKDGLQLQ
jgi:hypothetical protein